MARNPRYLPRPGAVVEITQRTLQGRFLLKPSKRLNALVVGCLARAQKNTGATVHAVAVLSNHFHLLVSFVSVEQMATFVGQFKTNLSKEVSRLHGWEGSIFAGRYQSVPVSDEPGIQLERLKYLLSQGTKEGLVLTARQWPGVHSATALVKGTSLRGVWVDRTRLYNARKRGEAVTEAQCTTDVELELEPLPCLAPASCTHQREVVREIVDAIDAQTLAHHQKHGTVPAGLDAVLTADPHKKPPRLHKSRKPHFHASGQVFRTLMSAFREFVAAYRRAAERLKSGDLTVEFPDNCYPPRSPFRPALALPCPGI